MAQTTQRGKVKIMSHRSFMYLLRPGGEPKEFETIAEANNTLPSLWQVLLADSMPGTALGCEQVLQGRGTINICADAQRGLARYRTLAAFIRRAPRTTHVAGLTRYLDAADQFLSQQVERWTLPGKPAPAFCANFDELSWMDDSRPNVFIAHRVEEFAQNWRAIQDAIRADNFTGLQELLAFDDWGMRYEEWVAWSAVFGFSSLGHLYFSGSYKEAREKQYADFDPDDDASNGENYLGGGCSRFKQDGKWGVHRWDEYLAPTVVLAPEWDRVLHAGEEEQELAWVQRDERIGLAAISGKNAGHVLLEPCLAATWDFVDGLAIAKRGERMGYLRRNASWFVEPTWDEVWRYAYGYAVVAKDGLHGYLNAEGKLAIPLRFAEADEFGAEGVARVKLGEHYGLIREDGTFAVDPLYSRLDWSDECSGWLTELNGKRGLMKVDGAAWIATEWDTIDCLVRGLLIRVSRDARCGAVDWQGRPMLACDYDDLQPRYPNAGVTAGAVALANEVSEQFAKTPVELIARRGAVAGLIDSSGRVIAPFAFVRIESFEPHSLPARRQFTRPELLRVYEAVDDGTRAKAGIWHIEQQRLIAPCIYDVIWMAKTSRMLNFSFLVARQNPPELVGERGRFSVGILNADGSTLFEPDFGWIASDLDAPGALAEVRSALYVEWSSNRPVEASPGKGATSLWLYPDGTRATHDERLATLLRRQRY